MKREASLLLFLALWPIVSGYAADEPPDWVRQAIPQSTPQYPAKVTAVVLLKEELLTVTPDGQRTTRERGVIKVLDRSSDPLMASRVYNVKSGRVRDFRAWLIPPTGKPSAFPQNAILDVPLSTEYVYDEARMKVIQAGNPPTGTIFAWEITEEEKTVFTQDAYVFQTGLPALVSRFILTLPPRWETKAVMFNRAEEPPRVDGSTYTWELRDLPWVENEAHGPSLMSVVPRLALTYYAPSGNAAGLPAWGTWNAVSQWTSSLVDPSAAVTEAIRTKAAQLTALSSTELEKIRSIGAFVQQTNYVEVALNVAKGGGYTPRAADETLKRNYGDCKDKVTLMRALLKAIGIDSYLTMIYAGDRDYVRPEWPSPMQFNHAIIAITLSEDSAGKTTFDSKNLGRLLMFDPTDPFTTVGNLPYTEQDSLALILAGDAGELARMPRLPSEASRIESNVAATVSDTGNVQARVREKYFGQSASPLFALTTGLGDAELKNVLQRVWSRRVSGANLSAFAAEFPPDHSSFSTDTELRADHFGPIMQGRLLVVHPGHLAGETGYGFASRKRTLPVALDSFQRRDIVRIKIPAGFEPDDIPDRVHVQTAHGSVEATWTFTEGEIVFEQAINVIPGKFSADTFSEIRDFFGMIAAVRGAPVVFIHK